MKEAEKTTSGWCGEAEPGEEGVLFAELMTWLFARVRTVWPWCVSRFAGTSSASNACGASVRGAWIPDVTRLVTEHWKGDW